MHCLIIGYGSVGKRHATIFKKLDCQVSLVTSQSVNDFACYRSIESALQHNIDYVIISNPTSYHYDTLLKLIQCDYRGVVLVEKPLFSDVMHLPPHPFKKILVAYNLRFHPLLQTLKNKIQDEKLITFSAYVGQYLPHWRKQTDYRQNYSAKKEQGGGVLRDLSHELDYSLWLCGPCHEVTAIGGHLSQLEITSDDVYSIVMKNALCPIMSLQLNYLDRTPRREIAINTQKHTIFVDLVKGVLSVDGEMMMEEPDGMEQSYIAEHQALLENHFDRFCDYQEGQTVVKLMTTIENAAASKVWMTL